MQYFNFHRLITKYMSQFTVKLVAKGHYDDKGDYVKDSSDKIVLNGAIISFKESKIFRSEGTLTTNDKRLFTESPISSKLIGSQVIYDNKLYNVEECTENAKFTGVYAYILRFVSAFKEAST